MDKFASTLKVLEEVGITITRQLTSLKTVEALGPCSVAQGMEFINQYAPDKKDEFTRVPQRKHFEMLEYVDCVTLKKERRDKSSIRTHATLTEKGTTILKVAPWSLEQLMIVQSAKLFMTKNIRVMWAVENLHKTEEGANVITIRDWSKCECVSSPLSLYRKGLLTVEKRLIKANMANHYRPTKKGEKLLVTLREMASMVK